MAFYPERVVFITGGILNVVHAQSEISHRLHELRSRDRVSALFTFLYISALDIFCWLCLTCCHLIQFLWILKYI